MSGRLTLQAQFRAPMISALAESVESAGHMRRRIFGGSLIGPFVLGLVIACVIAARPAAASVIVEIEKSTQRMYVTINGVTRYAWPVSTGRGRFGTPSGVFRPQRLERRWYSRRYYNAPMPYAVFFHRGYAIHGTNELSRLGGPASHGCVRLHPAHAATLFSLVQGFGPGRTRIAIFN